MSKSNYGLLDCCEEMRKYEKDFFEWNKDIDGRWHWIVLGACLNINYCLFCGKEMPKVPEHL